MIRPLLLTLLIVRTAAAGVCTIPLTPTKTGFVTTVSIDGKPLRFLVDTGATRTVLNGTEPTAATTALTTSGPTSVGESTVTLEAGAITTTLTVLVTPLPPFPSHGPVDGLLGMDVLRGHSFLIERNCLTIDAEPPRGKTFDAEEVAGRPSIHIKGMNWILDSGASFIVLLSKRAHEIAHADNEFEMTSASAKRITKSGSIELFNRERPAALINRDDPKEDALLPINIFESVWVSKDRKTVLLRPKA